jgi:amino acid permease
MILKQTTMQKLENTELEGWEEASQALVEIKECTCWNKAHARHAMHLFLTRHAVHQHRDELNKTLKERARTRGGVSIHDLEHYAQSWQSLVPASAAARAALAQHLSQEYMFTYRQSRRIRAVLGLDQSDVEIAYERLYQLPLETIYAGQVSFQEQLRGDGHALAAWLEHLPPFWISFALTLPVGPGLLALPIAYSGIGPLPGVILLLIFGAINMVTVAALAEALARSSSMRYSRSFFLGHLVEEYLGKAGSLIFTTVLLLDLVLVLLIFYLGIASTMSDATHVPGALWAALLFGLGLYFLSRKSLNTTLAITIIVGIINVTLILLLTLLAFSHLQSTNLFYINVPFLSGSPFDPVAVRLIFGVTLATFFSHMLVGNYGKLILQHDSSGRSLIHGSVAAIAFTTLVSALWVLAMNGALDPSALKNEPGTVLIPLSAEVGTAVRVLGAIFVIIGLGMASIHISLGLLFTMREWLSTGALSRLAVRKPFDTILTISPVIIIFLIAEWMLITGTGSFSELFGFVGVIALSLLAAIFPMLLLLSARRKGELVPTGGIYSVLAHPVLITGIYLFFLAAIFLHGAILWTDPIQRAGALVIGVLVLIATGLMFRHRAFAPRLVLELHQNSPRYGDTRILTNDLVEPNGEFGITAAGRAECATVRLVYQDHEENSYAVTGCIPDLSRLLSAEFHLGSSRAREVKVSARRNNRDGDLESLPMQLTIRSGHESRGLSLAETGGEVVLPFDGGELDLTLASSQSNHSAR